MKLEQIQAIESYLGELDRLKNAAEKDWHPVTNSPLSFSIRNEDHDAIVKLYFQAIKNRVSDIKLNLKSLGFEE